METAFFIFGLLAWLITAAVSLGRHSRTHDGIARVAMPLEGALAVLALAGGEEAWLWALAGLICLCFLAVALTDDIEGHTAVGVWLKQAMGLVWLRDIARHGFR